MRNKRFFAGVLILLLAVFILFGFVPTARADALDEILEYAVTVDVNEDGTLTMRYHFDWKVLDSTSEGPLSWINVGIPNANGISVKALSDTISHVGFSSGSGDFVRVDLDRDYYADEVVSFDFELVQDYMYEMNRFTDGETYYEFTPGWFDAKVDSLIIRWNSDKVKSMSPACLQQDGYCTWETSLAAGQTFTVSVTYPNDAFAFDDSKSIDSSDSGTGYDYSGYDSGYSSGYGCAGSAIGNVLKVLIYGGVMLAPVFIPILIGLIRGRANYSSTANFSGGESKKVITREKIVYHPSCPGCGAPRPEGKDNCEFCGRSFIKSKETVSEEQVPEEMREKTSNGTYRYGSDPNTFMRVNVVHVPITTARSSSTSRSSSSRSGSCAHSSCACVSSCACACACACAGGGRAGCSAKDFYNTGVRLEQLEPGKKTRHAAREKKDR